MSWPDLWELRGTLFPSLDKTAFGKEYKKFSFPTHPNERVGIIPRPEQEARRLLKVLPKVYPNNAAAVKYIPEDRSPTGERIYERGSYAHRPEGFLGKWQTHFRLFPVGDERTAVYVHWELNPLARPGAHYRGEQWSAEIGKRNAQKILDGELVVE